MQHNLCPQPRNNLLQKKLVNQGTIFCSALNHRRKMKEKTKDYEFRQQDKQIDNKLKLDEMNHAEKIAANKYATKKQQNDHNLSMADLRLRKQELEMKKNAMNHSSVTSQTLIGLLGQFIKFLGCLFNSCINSSDCWRKNVG